MEALGRGVVAVYQGEGRVFVGWRHLATEPGDVGFHVYRVTGRVKAVRLTKSALTGATHHVDADADLSQSNSYHVRPVVAGREGEVSRPFTLPAGAPARPYLTVPRKTLPGHTPKDASAGDLDRGEYE